MKKLLLCFLLFISSGTVHAQDAVIDSLQTQLDSHVSKDTLRVRLLNDLAFAYYRKDISKTLEYVEISEVLAKEINDKKGIAKSIFIRGVVGLVQANFDEALENFNTAERLYNEIDLKKDRSNCYQAMGVVCQYQGEFEQSIAYTEKANELNAELGLTKNIPNNLSNIAIVYSLMGKYDEAMLNLEKALELFVEGDERPKANCLNSIATIYSDQSNYPLALDYYNQSLSIYESLSDSVGISGALNNIGNIYEKRGNHNKALEYFKKALAILIKFDDNRTIAIINSNIANIYSAEGQNQKAIPLLKESIKVSKEIGNFNNVAVCLNNLGQIYIDQKNYTAALESLEEAKSVGSEHDLYYILSEVYLGIAQVNNLQNNYTQALQNALKSKELSIENNLLENERDANGVLSDIYRNKGDFEKAYFSHQHYKQLNDSLFNKENIEKITQLEYEYKYQTQLALANEREMTLTKKIDVTSQNLEKSQRNTLFGIIGILLLALVFGATIFFLKLKEQKEKVNAVLNEQKLLRSQMTPHFIFNSLSVLQGIILNKEEKKSVFYLSKFSKLLRTILENSREKTVSLKQELAATEDYIILQNINIDPPCDYSILVDEKIDTSLFNIPPMLIQPFIENAIEHAFGNIKSAKELKISLSYKEEKLICTISDNGVGIETHSKKIKNKTKKSLATTITSERLEVLSKDFKFKGSVTVEDRNKYNEQGTLVTLLIPYIKNKH